jgi:hypothetical protein
VAFGGDLWNMQPLDTASAPVTTIVRSGFKRDSVPSLEMTEPWLCLRRANS